MSVFAKALNIVLFDRSGSESRRQARVKMAQGCELAYEEGHSPILVLHTIGRLFLVGEMIIFKTSSMWTPHDRIIR